MSSSGRFRILPVLIILVMFSFSLRLAEIVAGMRHQGAAAYAQEHEGVDLPEGMDKPEEKKPEEKKDEKAKEEAAGAHDSDNTHEGNAHEEGETKYSKKTEKEKSVDPANDGDGSTLVFDIDKDGKAPEWLDANDSDLDVTSVRMELFKDLAHRRESLDTMEKNLQAREALLKAAEQELDRKYQELAKLRKEIEILLGQQSEAEKSRISSLVKIYEGMKPKDAARIFDTLDIDILVSVIGKMSERKVAPVLAAMNEDRARTLTIMLAEQKKLPLLPAQGN